MKKIKLSDAIILIVVIGAVIGATISCVYIAIGYSWIFLDGSEDTVEDTVDETAEDDVDEYTDGNHHPLGDTRSQIISAYGTCQMYIKDRLRVSKVPKWPYYGDINVNTLKDVKYGYSIEGYVDVPNSSGTLIRNYYQCDIRYLPNSEILEPNWELLYLEIDTGN